MTEHQKKAIDAYIKAGSYNKAAQILGKDPSNLRKLIKQLEAEGKVPWRSPAPNPSHLSIGKSTVQFDKHGDVIQEWRRQYPSAQMMQDVVDGLCERVKGKGRVRVTKPKKNSTRGILFEIDIFDAHVGMFADERETLDANYNCDIAAQRMMNAVQSLAFRANNPDKVVLVFGGDMLHADNRSNQTPSSGHILDVDTRYHRVVEYVITACSDCIDICSQIAPEVEVVILEGNHSPHSEVWLGQVLRAFYSNCPNIIIKTSPNPRKTVTN